MDGWIDKEEDGWMDGQMDEQKVECMRRWMD